MDDTKLKDCRKAGGGMLGNTIAVILWFFMFVVLMGACQRMNYGTLSNHYEQQVEKPGRTVDKWAAEEAEREAEMAEEEAEREAGMAVKPC